MSRKLDAALAEALGWTEIGLWSPAPDQQTNYWGIAPFGKERVMPYYSTDGNAMLELDREMRARGWLLDTWNETGVYALFKCSEDVDDDEVLGWTAQGHADTMPEAVALAAYHALTGKEWEE